MHPHQPKLRQSSYFRRRCDSAREIWGAWVRVRVCACVCVFMCVCVWCLNAKVYACMCVWVQSIYVRDIRLSHTTRHHINTPHYTTYTHTYTHCTSHTTLHIHSWLSAAAKADFDRYLVKVTELTGVHMRAVGNSNSIEVGSVCVCV
jgi:hypothetical protein